MARAGRRRSPTSRHPTPPDRGGTMNTAPPTVTRFEGVRLRPEDAADACDTCGKPLVVVAFRVTAGGGASDPTPLAIVCPACADEVVDGGLPALHAQRRAVIGVWPQGGRAAVHRPRRPGRRGRGRPRGHAQGGPCLIPPPPARPGAHLPRRRRPTSRPLAPPGQGRHRRPTRPTSPAFGESGQPSRRLVVPLTRKEPD